MIIGNGTNHKTANITVYSLFQAPLKHKQYCDIYF